MLRFECGDRERRRAETKSGHLVRLRLGFACAAFRQKSQHERLCSWRRHNSIGGTRLRRRSLGFLLSSLRVYSLACMREVVLGEPSSRCGMTERATFLRIREGECEGFCNRTRIMSSFTLSACALRVAAAYSGKACPTRASAFPPPSPVFIPPRQSIRIVPQRWITGRLDYSSLSSLEQAQGIHRIGEMERPIQADVTLAEHTLFLQACCHPKIPTMIKIKRPRQARETPNATRPGRREISRS